MEINTVPRFDSTDDAGAVVNHMPRNSPTLLPAEVVAKFRDWIAAGAQDD